MNAVGADVAVGCVLGADVGAADGRNDNDGAQLGRGLGAALGGEDGAALGLADGAADGVCVSTTILSTLRFSKVDTLADAPWADTDDMSAPEEMAVLTALVTLVSALPSSPTLAVGMATSIEIDTELDASSRRPRVYRRVVSVHT